MREMKDSGIEWIGDIPNNWRIVRNKNAFVCNKELVGKKSELTQLLSLTTRGIKKKDISNAEGKLPESFDTYQFVKENDIVMCLFDLDCSAVFSGISPFDGMISPAYRVLSCKECIDPRYAEYWFRYISDGRKFNHYAKNIRYTLSYDEFSALPLLLPERSQQRRIADYLDTRCAKIDAIIARQQQVIEKLKAYKLSVITEAVTKGLNPDVPMKDSGIEWIGLVPKHWDMVRLKFLLSQIIDCPHETPIYSADGNYLVIRTADQDVGTLRTDEDMYRIDESEYWNRIRRMSLEKNDIVYGREGERWGLACLVPESNKYCLGQRMLQFRCKSELFLPCFAMWALNSKFVYLQGAVDTIGSTSPHVNISTVRNFIIPVPKITEQREIAAHIDKKMLQLDKELELREILIRKLNDYKKSLIYEVVTGKQEIDADLSAVTSVVVLTPALIAELREKRAALMTRFIDGLGDKNKGRTQIQKCMSLAEGLIDLQLGTQLVRQHYGPYDEDIQAYEQIMAEHEWVNHTKKKRRIQYTHGKRFQEYHSVYQRFFGNYDREIQQIIDFVKPIKHTSEIGRMATLFAAWNDFILDGIPNPTDEQIISEVRSNWTDNKANTPVETWQDSLSKLRAAGMVPCGYGRHTIKLEEGDRTHG